MKYKLLAVDIDGTLLRRDGTIHPGDTAAIARLQASGVPVTIATGRLYSGTRSIARMIALEGPIACVDGSHIVDLHNDVALYYRAIVGNDARVLRTIVTSRAPASFLFAHDRIVHDARGAPFAAYVRTWSLNVDVVECVTEHPFWDHAHGVAAVVLVGLEADILGIASDLRAHLAQATFVVTFPVQRLPGVFALIVRASGATKGTAITWLSAHHRCTPAEVVVVGDWLNDVPMFEVAGRSFAMGQAPPAVKATATDHLDADAREGGGIAEAIRRVWSL